MVSGVPESAVESGCVNVVYAEPTATPHVMSSFGELFQQTVDPISIPFSFSHRELRACLWQHPPSPDNQPTACRYCRRARNTQHSIHGQEHKQRRHDRAAPDAGNGDRTMRDLSWCSVQAKKHAEHRVGNQQAGRATPRTAPTMRDPF